MNPTTSQPEGSSRNEDTYADLIAANFPSNPSVNDWACGMPLSYVQEMADHCLSQHDEARRGGHSLASTIAERGDDSELREGSLKT